MKRDAFIEEHQRSNGIPGLPPDYDYAWIEHPSYGDVAVSERTARHLSSLTLRPLLEYEPPLEPMPPGRLDKVPSSARFPELPKPAAFQLALDLSWAQEHRVEVPQARIRPVDFQITRRLLTAVVEVLDRRRPLLQLQPHLDAQVFGAMETRLRDPPDPLQALHLRSVHACQPVIGVIEACAVVSQGQRRRALVARLEGKREWLCTLLRMV